MSTAAPRSLSVGGRTIAVALVPRGADGLPVRPGAARTPTGWIVRLAAPTRAPTGSPLTLTFGDGRSIRARLGAGTVEPAARAGRTSAPLALVAPAGTAGWTVRTGR